MSEPVHSPEAKNYLGMEDISLKSAEIFQNVGFYLAILALKRGQYSLTLGRGSPLWNGVFWLEGTYNNLSVQGIVQTPLKH